jgi:hypothetical protein
MPEPEVRVTQYTVSLLPESYGEYYHWIVTVEYRGKGKWAVLHFSFCLGSDGGWDYEPSPSNREDDWLATHRFDEETALALAREHAPKVSVNGLTPAGILARHPELLEAGRG